VTNFFNAEAAIQAGEKISFSFGENWQKYLAELTEERIQQAESSLRESFGAARLKGVSFLDIGCGSGLFSFCACRAGAKPLVSVDIDPKAIECARSLRLMADPASDWQVLSGSILDDEFLSGIPPATNVFSWGVLHHTGAMWRAIENTVRLVAPGGRCCLALYNRPNHPRLMLALKRIYNRLPRSLKPSMRIAYGVAILTMLAVRRRNPVRYVRDYGKRSRGMSFWRDVEDWLGGLPYEYATPDEVSSFVGARGLVVTNVIVRSPGACNEYLIVKPS
jgi:SAM-dependent methyltransferase